MENVLSAVHVLWSSFFIENFGKTLDFFGFFNWNAKTFRVHAQLFKHDSTVCASTALSCFGHGN